MEVIQTIKLSKEEIKSIENTLAICDRMSEISHCSMNDVFDYLVSQADIVDEYLYEIKDDIMQIAEIG